jgi:hypothetical protein
LFGYIIEDLPDVEHWWPLAYPDQIYREEVRREWESRIERAFQNKTPFEPLEATVLCKDGSRRHVEFSLSSIGEKHLITFVDLTHANGQRMRCRHEHAIPSPSFVFPPDWSKLKHIPDVLIRRRMK